MALNSTMQGVVWEGTPFQMNVTNLAEPTILNQTDAIVQVTLSAICGTDLHTYHGVYGSQEVPWVMGHEAIGLIHDVGSAVSSLTIGDKVVIPDQASDGHLDMGAPDLVAFGLGLDYGLATGCQAEYVRVPFADESLIHIPSSSSNSSTNLTAPNLDLDYLFVSDIFATGWSALDFSGFEAGESVAVFGAGPVGLLSAYSAVLRGATRVYLVDHVHERLRLGESIGAIPIDFTASDPVEQILKHEPNGVRRSVDCVGFEALNGSLEHQENEVIMNMVAVTATGGGIGQVGVFSASADSPGTPLGRTMSPTVQFPSSDFFNKGLRFQAGGVDPKHLAPQLVELIESGKARPSFIVSSIIDIAQAPEYYRRFDQHQETKVVIQF
ncbi:GroES-like protein [Xylona heveae TC161]|uniref:GroES-like protein n=1 Tax=Xylona heveae (strain CBS 132557 / TC161) TaxID=1328760 RepID=A0A165H7T5_XYLHT|nr:GroES-like protein [Xylona heveae TC161]KZF23104.1 GroES-like protein [Xylona heveae TC161]